MPQDKQSRAPVLQSDCESLFVYKYDATKKKAYYLSPLIQLIRKIGGLMVYLYLNSVFVSIVNVSNLSHDESNRQINVSQLLNHWSFLYKDNTVQGCPCDIQNETKTYNVESRFS